MRKLFASLLLLLCGVPCIGQTPLHGLTAGQSTRDDVERAAGKPIKFYSQTLVEYHPHDFAPTTWDKNVAKMYVQYRANSPIVERMEVLLERPITRSDAYKSVEASTKAARQPDLPEQATARGKNGVHLVEYFGAPYYLVVTYESGDVQSGVARSARYSRELFESAVNSLSSNASSGGAPSRASVPSNGSVTGHWTGSWTNSHGDSGQSTFNIKEESGNTFTGEEESFSMAPALNQIHRDGWTILNGRRSGNVLTWEYRNQNNGCRDYTIRWELSPDGRLANGTYRVTDRCTKETYSGSYLNYHR